MGGQGARYTTECHTVFLSTDGLIFLPFCILAGIWWWRTRAIGPRLLFAGLSAYFLADLASVWIWFSVGWFELWFPPNFIFTVLYALSHLGRLTALVGLTAIVISEKRSETLDRCGEA